MQSCAFGFRLEENEKLVLTPFEKNLDIWRQLWRVLERSDLVKHVVSWSCYVCIFVSTILYFSVLLAGLLSLLIFFAYSLGLFFS